MTTVEPVSSQTVDDATDPILEAALE